MKVIRGKRFKAIVDLRGLTKERYTVTLRIVMRDGRVLRRHRRFWTCTPASRVGTGSGSNLAPFRRR
jgi:hypothetical protein